MPSLLCLSQISPGDAMFERPVKINLGEAQSVNNLPKKISITLDDLNRHQYVIGATGSGKSTLIINEILDAFRQGLCTWVIDPHGDLAYDIVEAAYPEDLGSVLIFDPLKVGFSLNPFDLPKYGDQTQRSMMIERMISHIGTLDMERRIGIINGVKKGICEDITETIEPGLSFTKVIARK